MKLIFLTNFYPPASQGGYERWCQEVAEGLRACGHDILVLTSRWLAGKHCNTAQTWVRRELNLEMPLESLKNGVSFFTSRKLREQENLTLLHEVVATERPDAVLVWGMWNLPRSLVAEAEVMMPGRVVYYMGDYWPTLPSQYEYYWQARARNWLTAIPKNVLGLAARRILAQEKLPALQFEHVLFPTAFMCSDFQKRGLPLKNTKIIYGAVDTTPYRTEEVQTGRSDGRLNLLYAGRLTQEKGVHTAIEAVGRLVTQHSTQAIHLTIAGGGAPAYVTYLQRLIRQERIESFVTLLGPQPAEKMPELYKQADIFLFTSIWDEPFGRVLVEAMASGAIVVGTATGGAREILVEEENALIFPPGDAEALATQIVRLAESPALRQTLIANGRQIARERFDQQRMTAEIAAYLQAVVSDR